MASHSLSFHKETFIPSASDSSLKDVGADISLKRFFNKKVRNILGAGILLAGTGCGSDVDDPNNGEGGSALQPDFFECEASGYEYPMLVSEFAVPQMYNLGTLEAVDDTNSDLRILDLNFTGNSPLDQSTIYKCEFKGGNGCYLSVNPVPGTMYEAAQLQSSNYIKWYTWPENGETETRTSDELLEAGQAVVIQVVSVPEANGSYPVQISLNPECQ